METHIQQWGNSLAVRLPRAAVEKLKFHKGSKVKLTPRARTLVIELEPSRKVTLEDLVAKITPRNRHKLIDWGKPVGKEIW